MDLLIVRLISLLWREADSHCAHLTRYDETGAWTVEGFINIQPGSSGNTRYMFSYAGPGAGQDNCLLVRANVSTEGVWVHWAMTVAAVSRDITHYINGTLAPGMTYSTSWCGAQGGSLVLGQDQDVQGGNFNADQSVRYCCGFSSCVCACVCVCV